MYKKIALIISDEGTRRDFLFHQFRRAGMQPVSFFNQCAYMIDAESRDPGVLVIDLAAPFEKKLRTAQWILDQFPRMKVITIGNRQFPGSEKLFEHMPNHITCDGLVQLKC
ncbi:MAG TPA: hypothetical protein PKW95_15745 [bacterium]|nr:hypothetical protein [bacterium]